MNRENIRLRFFSKIDAPTAAFQQVFIGARLGRTDKKVLLDPKQDPRLWDSFFPGYRAEVENDRNLWRNYFYREFEAKVTSAALSEDSSFGTVVYQSFTGCFDILRRYGADILVMGASDVAQAVPPDELSKYFPGRKILMCASPTLSPHNMLATLQLISQIYPATIPKPKMLILGMSRTMWFLPSVFYPSLSANKSELLRHYKQSDFLGPHYAYWNQPHFIPWTWNVIYPIRRDANHLPLVNRLQHPERWSILDIQVTRYEYEKDPEQFNRQRALNPQTSSIFLGVDKNTECGDKLAGVAPLFKEIQRQALSVADELTVFTTPTMGDELRAAPNCYLEKYDRSIESIRDAKTAVINKLDRDYGLSPLDFAFQEKKSAGELLTFDVAHVNYFGAIKVTRDLAAAIKGRAGL